MRLIPPDITSTVAVVSLFPLLKLRVWLPAVRLVVKAILPVPPHTPGCVTVPAVSTGGDGAASIPLMLVLHPCISVTVTVYVPALRPVAVAPVCAGLLFQL